MKKLFLFIVGLLIAMTADATTGDASVLNVDSISNLFGNRLAQLTQLIDIGLRNTSSTDYEGRLYLLAYDKAADELHPCKDTLVVVKAYATQQLLLACSLPEGNLELRLAADAEGRQVVGTSQITILPLRKLDFQATFSLDMLTETDGEQVLYGSRIRGWARVQNDDTPYHGAHGGTADDDGIVLWLEDCDSGERPYTKHITSKLELGVIETTFAYDAVFHDGARYALKVGYGMPYGLEAIDSLCFTTRTGTNTYWTAQGQVLPLPLGDNQQLTVPAEAVAVDLRGQQAVNAVFAIDASQANPNCLYYLNLPDNVPQGLDETRNLVRGLEADNIRLTEDNDFFCPLAFHAKYISHLMTPTYDNIDDELRGRGYSGTIVLPFQPSYANLYDVNGNTEMLHADMLQVLKYLGNSEDSLNVDYVESLTQMEPYVPYILGVYIGSSLLFIGENRQVPMTREAIVRGLDINFVGTTVERQLTSAAYQYNPDDNHFYPSTARIAPFRAYMDLEDGTGVFDYLYFSEEVWGTQGNPSDATAISELPQRQHAPAVLSVYSLSGQRLTEMPAHRQTPSLRRGIYIVGGRKVVVR